MALKRTALLIVSLVLSVTTPLQANDIPADPYNSVVWTHIAKRFFPGEIVFDQAVRVMAPASAENQFHVPVTVDASALENVEEIVAVADLNPIPKILSVRPHQALSYVGFRVKLQQGSPIHVGVRTADGVWHMGGAEVDAAGGGCTAPAAAHGISNWMETLGQSRAVARRDDIGQSRFTFRMQHPMDTGLAPGIPAFYMNEIKVRDAAGQAVADIELFEPVSENPTLTLKPKLGRDSETLSISARDTEGNVFNFAINVPATQPN